MKPCFALVCFSLSFPICASELAACSSRQLSLLKETLKEHMTTEGLAAKLIKNRAGATLGYFAWRDTSGEEPTVRAAVCEYLEDGDYAVASEWFYWENGLNSANPARWKKGAVIEVAQDEGELFIDVKKASRSGDIDAEVRILGTGEGVVRGGRVVFANP